MCKTLMIGMSAFAVFGLAGCQTAKPIAMSVSVTPTTSGGVGSDVLAAERQAGQDIPPLEGQEVVTVRTYEYTLKTEAVSATRTELEGIDCVLESDGYRAEVKTPAQVTVPDYGYASRPIRVNCRAPGFNTGTATVQIFSKTTSGRMETAQHGGLAGVVLVAMIDAATDKKKHDYGYLPADVTMNRVGCEATRAGCR